MQFNRSGGMTVGSLQKSANFGEMMASPTAVAEVVLRQNPFRHLGQSTDAALGKQTSILQHNEPMKPQQEQVERIPLPNLIPQKTNVLTGSNTRYYQDQPSIWSSTYQSYMDYQAKDKPQSQPADTKVFRHAGLSMTSKNTTAQSIQLPLKGQPLYIGDRQRDTALRNEIMTQMNEHKRLLGEVQAKIMIDEEEKIIQSQFLTQNPILDLPYDLGEGTRASSQNPQPREAVMAKQYDPASLQKVESSSYAVLSGVPPETSKQHDQLNLPQQNNEVGTSATPSGAGRYDSLQTKRTERREKAVVNLSIPDFSKNHMNKNDFYRFLLQQNQAQNSQKTNNDILIPRSILKRNNPGNLVKDQRLEEATREYNRYQEEQLQKRYYSTEDDFEEIGKYDALFGKHIAPTNPLLQPKIAHLVRASQQFDAKHPLVDEDLAQFQLPPEPGHINRERFEIPDLLPIQSKPEHVTLHKTLDEQATPQVQELYLDKTNASESEATTNSQKIKVRRAQKVEGVFETGLEVTEHEVDLGGDQSTVVQIQKLFEEGIINKSQMEELLIRQLRQQKIFAFNSYDEFFGEYFQRELVAIEDMNRVHQIVAARKRYSRLTRGGQH